MRSNKQEIVRSEHKNDKRAEETRVKIEPDKDHESQGESPLKAELEKFAREIGGTSQIKQTIQHIAHKSAADSSNDQNSPKPKQECPECGKFLANVKEHLKAFHWKVKNYACKSCNYKCFNKNDLFKHVKAKHCSDVSEADYINVSKILKEEVAEPMVSDFHGFNLWGDAMKGFDPNKPKEATKDASDDSDDSDDPNDDSDDSKSIEKSTQTPKPENKEQPVSSQTPDKTDPDSPKSQCPHCNKMLSNLTEHIKSVHKKEKCYFCSLCTYQTMFKSDLAKHDESVHKKMRKTCTECGKQIANLPEHIRMVHRKEKRFSCNFCGYMCAKQSDMKKHTKNVHKLDFI